MLSRATLFSMIISSSYVFLYSSVYGVNCFSKSHISDRPLVFSVILSFLFYCFLVSTYIFRSMLSCFFYTEDNLSNYHISLNTGLISHPQLSQNHSSLFTKKSATALFLSLLISIGGFFLTWKLTDLAINEPKDSQQKCGFVNAFANVLSVFILGMFFIFVNMCRYRSVVSPAISPNSF